MADGGGGALPDLSRLAVTPTGQMIAYDPATSNGHDACAITHEEFEEGEMVWRNSEDGPITALYKPEAIYRWLHTPRLSEDGNGLWEDPVTRKEVSYMRETNPTDGLLRWMSAKNATPIVIDADPKELQFMPLGGWRGAAGTRPPDNTGSDRGTFRLRSYQWLWDINTGMNAVTGKKSRLQFDIAYANGEKAHICYEPGALVQKGDRYRRPIYGPGNYYRMVGTRYGINVYRLTNMPGHMMSILWKFEENADEGRQVEADIDDAKANQRTELLPELYAKHKRIAPLWNLAADYTDWMIAFLTHVAPSEKAIVDEAGKADEDDDCEYRAFGGGMETLSPLDAIRVVPRWPDLEILKQLASY